MRRFIQFLGLGGVALILGGCLASSPSSGGVSNEGTLKQASIKDQSPLNQKGKELFERHCVMCHSLTRPKDPKNMVAPAIAGVMFHVKERYPNKEDAVRFIVDYVRSPSHDKALCPSVKRFGLMPPINLPKEDLEAIASYLFDNFPPEGFKHRGGGMFRR